MYCKTMLPPFLHVWGIFKLPITMKRQKDLKFMNFGTKKVGKREVLNSGSSMKTTVLLLPITALFLSIVHLVLGLNLL